MGTRPKALSIHETKYPLDYDKNNQSDFENWKRYIHNELSNMISPGEMLMVELTKVVTKMPKKKTCWMDRVDGDWITYLLMFAAAVALAIVSTK